MDGGLKGLGSTSISSPKVEQLDTTGPRSQACVELDGIKQTSGDDNGSQARILPRDISFPMFHDRTAGTG